MSRAGQVHGFICGNIARILGNFAFERGRGLVCTNDTGVVVERDPDTVRGPDVLFYDQPVNSIDDLAVKWQERPANLAVEILSPNDKPGKVNQRIRELIAFGTPVVWVVDPDLRCVTVYRPGVGRQIQQVTVEENEELTGDDVLPDFRRQVADFFAVPMPKSP